MWGPAKAVWCGHDWGGIHRLADAAALSRPHRRRDWPEHALHAPRSPDGPHRHHAGPDGRGDVYCPLPEARRGRTPSLARTPASHHELLPAPPHAVRRARRGRTTPWSPSRAKTGSYKGMATTERKPRTVPRSSRWCGWWKPTTPRVRSAGPNSSPTTEFEVFAQTPLQRTGFTGGINWYRNFTRNWARSEADLPGPGQGRSRR